MPDNQQKLGTWSDILQPITPQMATFYLYSENTGSFWMGLPASFKFLKLTNKKSNYTDRICIMKYIYFTEFVLIAYIANYTCTDYPLYLLQCAPLDPKSAIKRTRASAVGL